MYKLNYKAKLSNQIGNVLGPNEFNEKMIVVAQEYDEKTNITTLSLKIHRGV